MPDVTGKRRSGSFTGPATRWTLWGLLLGLGAPAGFALLRAISLGTLAPAALAGDFHFLAPYYLYLTLTPIVFSGFGYFLGRAHAAALRRNDFLQRLAGQLDHQASQDEVTGLMNRHRLNEEIQTEIDRARRHRRPLCGLMIDLDDFKRVNDRHGHQAGDTVLRKAAAVLKNSIRNVDVVGRYGGDEFMVLLPETGIDEARRVADRVRKRLNAHPIRLGHETLNCTASIGLTLLDGIHGMTVRDFIGRADRAMFDAKAAGKNAVSIESARLPEAL